MARKLAQGLTSVAGARLLHPVDANEIFIALPEPTVSALEMQGFHFYRWPLDIAESGITVRLVTSYGTPSADVDALVAAAASITSGG
jgi:threonine aldolase